MHTSDAQVHDQARADEFLVLVIEDDSLDFTILERQLRNVQVFKLVWAQSMREGLAELEQHPFDVILLDLSLPDSNGLSTVEAFTAQTNTPVVVVSGLDDEETALKAVKHGAQDYLVKGQYSTALICKTLRYAVERYRLLEELNQSRELIQRERELRRLESDVAQLHPVTTQETQPHSSLVETHPSVHRYAVGEYSGLLDKAIEKRNFKTAFNPSVHIRELAMALGSYQATPRDIIDIHTLSVDVRISGMTANRRRLRSEEARYLLTGLLGHLCSFYLSHCKQLPPGQSLPGMEQTAPAKGKNR